MTASRLKGCTLKLATITLAATLANQNAEFTRQSTAVQQYQTHRNFEKSEGNTQAEFGASGVTGDSVSSEAILRENAGQGALSKQLLGQQGLITEAGYTEQANADTALAQYANQSAQTINQTGTITEIGALLARVCILVAQW